MSDDRVARMLKNQGDEEVYHDGKFKRLSSMTVRAVNEKKLKEIASHVADEFGDDVFDGGGDE